MLLLATDLEFAVILFNAVICSSREKPEADVYNEAAVQYLYGVREAPLYVYTPDKVSTSLLSLPLS